MYGVCCAPGVEHCSYQSLSAQILLTALVVKTEKMVKVWCVDGRVGDDGKDGPDAGNGGDGIDNGNDGADDADGAAARWE